MAGALTAVLRNSIHYRPIVGKCIFQIECVRSLYSKTTLGIDSFLDQRENIRKQLLNISDRFKQKMQQFANENSTSMIFTEDLKNMLHLTETNEDVELVIKMMKKFNQQNKELRFGNFVFGTVVMRMFHVLNKPDEAVKCFKAPELQGFFDQLMSYQILLDLLYENKRYDEVLEIFEIIKDKQIQGIKYPKNVVVLVLAACYKLNTPESYNYAKELWKDLKSVGHKPMRRAATFCAGLALNQGHPEDAIEIISTSPNQGYTTVRNIKVAALTDVGRIEDCIPILKSILTEDKPDSNAQIKTFNKDVIAKVKQAIEKSDSQELKSEFARIEKFFEEQGHISQMTLDEQLCSEIVAPAVVGRKVIRPQNQYRRLQRNNFDNFEPIKMRRSFGAGNRPGLTDIA